MSDPPAPVPAAFAAWLAAHEREPVLEQLAALYAAQDRETDRASVERELARSRQ